MRQKLIFTLLALTLFVGAFSLSAYAYTPPEADATPTPPPTSAAKSESAVPSGKTITPDGNATVMDTLTGADGKVFYTFKTPEDNVFYLVIDEERKTDNVYFLNAVTEDDLIALAEKKKDGKGTTTSAIPASSPAPSEVTPSPSPTPAPTQQSGGGFGGYLWLILAVLAAGGIGWYFKIYKPKKDAPIDDDLDEDDYEDDFEDSEDENLADEEENE